MERSVSLVFLRLFCNARGRGRGELHRDRPGDPAGDSADPGPAHGRHPWSHAAAQQLNGMYRHDDHRYVGSLSLPGIGPRQLYGHSEQDGVPVHPVEPRGDARWPRGSRQLCRGLSIIHGGHCSPPPASPRTPRGRAEGGCSTLISTLLYPSRTSPTGTSRSRKACRDRCRPCRTWHTRTHDAGWVPFLLLAFHGRWPLR